MTKCDIVELRTVLWKGGANLKIRLHRPKRGLWNLALLLFVLGLLGSYVAIPILSGYAFYLIVVSAALLLLGTWII